MALQHLMHQALLVLEVVIELAFAGPRGVDDLVWTCRPNPLFVKQVGSCLDDPKLRLGSSSCTRFHSSPLANRSPAFIGAARRPALTLLTSILCGRLRAAYAGKPAAS